MQIFSLRGVILFIISYLPLLVASYSSNSSHYLAANATANATAVSSSSSVYLPTESNDWSNLSAVRAVALRTQRDISANITVASNMAAGIDLTQTLFDVLGYNSVALSGFRGLLDVGVQAFAVDLYYNQHYKDWGLCPSRTWSNSSMLQCDSTSAFNISSFISTLNSFLTDTTTQLDTNTIYLLFKLNTIDVKNPKAMTNITDLATPFSTLLYSARESHLSQNQVPSLSHMLFTEVVRAIPIVIENNIPENEYNFTLENSRQIFYLSNTIYNNSTRLKGPLLNTDYEYYATASCRPSNDFNSTTFRFSYDTNADPFTEELFQRSMLCGYTPIINHHLDRIEELVPYLKNSFWTWGVSQPNLTTSDSDYDDDLATYSDPNRCAILTSSGWASVTCDEEHYTICQNKSNNTEFKALKKKLTFQDANDACSNLDDDWEVALPNAAVVQKQLIETIPEDEESVWINLNSLSARNCWVVGIDTACPYQKIVNKQVFRRMITPGTIIAFLLVVLIISLHFDSVPIHRNRNHWKRLLTEKLKNEYEGVSS